MDGLAGGRTTAGSGTIREIGATVLHPGAASGLVLALDEPVSFWGGVSASGEIIDRHHPQCGVGVTGRVLVMSSGRGSSSASSVLAEQIRAGTAPAAILLAEPDAILVIGAVVAAEMYGTKMPLLLVSAADLESLPTGAPADIDMGSGCIGGKATVRVTMR